VLIFRARSGGIRTFEVGPKHIVQISVDGLELTGDRLVHEVARKTGGADDLDVQTGQRAVGSKLRLGIVKEEVLGDHAMAPGGSRHLIPHLVVEPRAQRIAVEGGTAVGQVGIVVDDTLERIRPASTARKE